MTDIQIPNCFSIPQGIKRAIEEKNLVLFIGAGVSRLTGCWSWDQLARGLIQKCHQLDVLDGRFDHPLQQNIKKDKIPEVIDFCYKQLKQNLIKSFQ